MSVPDRLRPWQYSLRMLFTVVVAIGMSMGALSGAFGSHIQGLAMITLTALGSGLVMAVSIASQRLRTVYSPCRRFR